jgi:flagellar biogenesis protein FliO
MRVSEKTATIGGLAGWLLGRLRGGGRNAPRLALVERIALGPRQSLALIEAEGRRFLVATSAEGSPSFCALDERRALVKGAIRQASAAHHGAARVSW